MRARVSPEGGPIVRGAQDDEGVRSGFALWLDAAPRPGALNMAIDLALLERARAGERWLRLYAWDPACLSFGRHEPAARRYDRTRIEALGLDVVRRPTGGRAVWHAGELTYAVAAPAAGLGALARAYRTIHGMIRDALRSLGAAAQLAPARPAAKVDAGACFAAAAGGEVVVSGEKVVGSAQLRDGGALLQHGSILLNEDQAMVARVTLGAPPPDRSAPLARVLGRAVDWNEAAAAVTEAVAASWEPVPDRAADRGRVLARARALEARFRSPAWTWEGADSG